MVVAKGWLGDVEVCGADHAATHARCPFLYLGSNVSEECVRGPASEDHNFVDRFVG
jgi:hypothetical protein